MYRAIAKRYFDSLYRAMSAERHAAQKSALEYDPEALLLDCGCREGHHTIELAQQVGTERIIGLDHNLRVLSQGARLGIATLQADLDFSIPLTNNSVAVVIASHVLEHLINPDTFVAEIYRVLQPGGYVVLDTPNLASWHNIFALLIGVQPFSGPNITTMADSDIELVRQMHRSSNDLSEDNRRKVPCERETSRHIVVVAYVSLLRLLRRHGFQIEIARGFGYYPLPPFLARLFQRIDPRHTHHLQIRARKPDE